MKVKVFNPTYGGSLPAYQPKRASAMFAVKGGLSFQPEALGAFAYSDLVGLMIFSPPELAGTVPTMLLFRRGQPRPLLVAPAAIQAQGFPPVQATTLLERIRENCLFICRQPGQVLADRETALFLQGKPLADRGRPTAQLAYGMARGLVAAGLIPEMGKPAVRQAAPAPAGSSTTAHQAPPQAGAAQAPIQAPRPQAPPPQAPTMPPAAVPVAPTAQPARAVAPPAPPVQGPPVQTPPAPMAPTPAVTPAQTAPPAPAVPPPQVAAPAPAPPPQAAPPAAPAYGVPPVQAAPPPRATPPTPPVASPAGQHAQAPPATFTDPHQIEPEVDQAAGVELLPAAVPSRESVFDGVDGGEDVIGLRPLATGAAADAAAAPMGAPPALGGAPGPVFDGQQPGPVFDGQQPGQVYDGSVPAAFPPAQGGGTFPGYTSMEEDGSPVLAIGPEAPLSWRDTFLYPFREQGLRILLTGSASVLLAIGAALLLGPFMTLPVVYFYSWITVAISRSGAGGELSLSFLPSPFDFYLRIRDVLTVLLGSLINSGFEAAHYFLVSPSISDIQRGEWAPALASLAIRFFGISLSLVAIASAAIYDQPFLALRIDKHLKAFMRSIVDFLKLFGAVILISLSIIFMGVFSTMVLGAFPTGLSLSLLGILALPMFIVTYIVMYMTYTTATIFRRHKKMMDSIYFELPPDRR